MPTKESNSPSKGQRAKSRIVESALELFAKNGYDATSVQQIADLCELSQTNIFYHFKSKRILFEYTVQSVIEHNRQIIKERKTSGTGPLAELTTFIHGNIDWAYNYGREFQIIMLLLYFSASSDEFKQLATKLFTNAQEVVTAQIEELKQLGHCRSSCASNDLSQMIQQYINGLQYQLVSRGDRDEIYANSQRNVDYMLKSILQLNADAV